MSVINDQLLEELLPKYYKRLFPYYLLCKWLGYSEGKLLLTIDIAHLLLL